MVKPRKRNEGCFDLSCFEQTPSRRERNQLCEVCHRERIAFRIQSPYGFPNQKSVLVCPSCKSRAERMMHEHYVDAIEKIVENKKPVKRQLKEFIAIIIIESSIIAGIATLAYRDVALSHITWYNIITSTRTIPYAFLMFMFITILLAINGTMFQGLIQTYQWQYDNFRMNLRWRKWLKNTV